MTKMPSKELQAQYRDAQLKYAVVKAENDHWRALDAAKKAAAAQPAPLPTPLEKIQPVENPAIPQPAPSTPPPAPVQAPPVHRPFALPRRFDAQRPVTWADFPTIPNARSPVRLAAPMLATMNDEIRAITTPDAVRDGTYGRNRSQLLSSVHPRASAAADHRWSGSSLISMNAEGRGRGEDEQHPMAALLEARKKAIILGRRARPRP